MSMEIGISAAEPSALKRRDGKAGEAARPNVAVVYTHVPHYREPVFNELVASEKFACRIYTSRGVLDSTIKSYEGSHIDYRSRLLKRGPLLWQTRLWGLTIGREADVLVFLGNPYIVSTWLYCAVARIIGRKKILFWTHGWTKTREGMKGRIRDAFYRMAHGLLLYGDRAKEIAIDKGFDPRSIFVIYNSLDYESQRRCRTVVERAAAQPGGGRYFVSIGRLVPELGLDVAISAFGKLRRERGVTIPFVLIGDGPEQDRLLELARAEGVHVKFLGAMYKEEDVGPVLSGALALVSPGKVGLAAMHSLAYGVPVITHGDFEHQMPEVEAVRPGVTGEFFERGDPASLADVLARWFSRDRDMERARIAIQDIEERYTPARQRAAIEKAVSAVVGGKGA
jgi:glycosyltransferase involved in cell wall biosynthesis